jgi:hypothetical protein
MNPALPFLFLFLIRALAVLPMCIYVGVYHFLLNIVLCLSSFRVLAWRLWLYAGCGCTPVVVVRRRCDEAALHAWRTR